MKMQPVVLYTTAICGFCQRAKAWLNARGVPYQEVDVSGDDVARAALVERSGGQKTVPQIFVGDVHVGGYSDLVALDAAGKFQPLLDSDKE
jgi:glutaredoxin 3